MLWLLWTQLGTAQTFDVVGTRAQGMGGAFVGVADDASAVYWNPGGLARGAYFSLLLDGSSSEATPDRDQVAANRGGWLLALTTPALGLSYYRLRNTVVRPRSADSPSAPLPFETLVTHHVGGTVVQSLSDGVAVGATVKLIRGTAGEGVAPADDPEDLLNDWDVFGRSTTRVDLDLGIMATGSMGSIGLTVRNVSEPAFVTANDVELRLDRQARAGASILLLQSWKLAADVDLTANDGPFGELRELAIGTEGQVTRRITARGGVRLNTAGDRGRTPALSVGASFAVRASVFLDAHFTGGSDETFRGWGLAGRLAF